MTGRHRMCLPYVTEGVVVANDPKKWRADVEACHC
jgi:hypothetical protein